MENEHDDHAQTSMSGSRGGDHRVSRRSPVAGEARADGRTPRWLWRMQELSGTGALDHRHVTEPGARTRISRNQRRTAAGVSAMEKAVRGAKPPLTVSSSCFPYGFQNV